MGSNRDGPTVVLIQGGAKYVATVDRFSKIAIAKPVTSKFAANVTEAILEIVGQYGQQALIIKTRDVNLGTGTLQTY